MSIIFDKLQKIYQDFQESWTQIMAHLSEAVKTHTGLEPSLAKEHFFLKI